MEALLAEEIFAAERVLTALAESSRDGKGGAVDHRAQRLEATVARIEAELAAIERLFVAGAGKSLRPAKPASAADENGRMTEKAARRGRGRPRKLEGDTTSDNLSESSAVNDTEATVS